MRYTYKEWVDPRTSEKAFTSKYEKLDDYGKGQCDTHMQHLRDQPPANWVEPRARKLASKLDKKCKGIYEIRFEAHRVQQRPMGYFNGEEFVIVIWVTHKGKQYTPKNFCEIAKRRWGQICSGVEQTIEIEID